MAITTAISDFFASILELFSSVFNGAYALVHSIFTAAFNFVSGIFTLITDLLSGVIDVGEGIGKFVFGKSPESYMCCEADANGWTGNVVIIALVGAGVFAYMRYTAQGQKLATGKKTN